MLIHLLKSVYRNFRSQPLYSVIILLSLTLGYTFLSFLSGFLDHELAIDNFRNRDRIYRLIAENPVQRDKTTVVVPQSTVDYMHLHVPEIEAMCALRSVDLSIRQGESKVDRVSVVAADSTFFEFFNFPVSNGNAVAFRKGGIILQHKVAEKFPSFPEAGDPVTIEDTGYSPFKVEHTGYSKETNLAGIIQDPELTSHLSFDAVINERELHGSRFSQLPQVTCYVSLRAGIDPETVATKLSNNPDLPNFLGKGNMKYRLQPLSEIYFDTSHNTDFNWSRAKSFIWICGLVVFLILAITMFNFINLFTLSLVHRSKEVGVRRLLGAGAGNIRLVALFELILYSVGALLLAFTLSALFLNELNTVFSSDLLIGDLFKVRSLAMFLMAVLLLGGLALAFLSGQLSGIKPVALVASRQIRKVRINKFLLTFQFTITAVLVVCTVTIARQMRHIETKPLGFDRNIIQLTVPSDSLHQLQLRTFKAGILADGYIQRVTIGGNPIYTFLRGGYPLENDQDFSPNLMWGDQDFMSTLGFTLLKGNIPTKGFLVNESLIQYFSMDDPLGKLIPGSKSDIISGVVKDFNLMSLRNEIGPTIISITDRPSSYLQVNYSGLSLNETLQRLDQHWQKIFPDLTFTYELVDVALIAHHAGDVQFSRLIITCAVVSTLLSCFGLLALAWGITQNRRKEIGIRKTIGATSLEIFRMLTLDFSRWILLAYLMAAPVAGYFMNRWLQEFAYRVELDAVTFFIAGASIFLLALSIVSLYSIQTARVNPVKELRTE